MLIIAAYKMDLDINLEKSKRMKIEKHNDDGSYKIRGQKESLEFERVEECELIWEN